MAKGAAAVGCIGTFFLPPESSSEMRSMLRESTRAEECYQLRRECRLRWQQVRWQRRMVVLELRLSLYSVAPSYLSASVHEVSIKGR
jgi:hypothetical protein